ncbi:retinoic acid receptor responder protein 1 [Suncus etruscus]|uniref:retinoic acid receptor responder protein 1 n=1 Tax=Suncus etruscus TaxID=109475 RepID=UPI002110368F|nr:retinoic acid receptor responder protein 1 [Suncus etruscus]
MQSRSSKSGRARGPRPSVPPLLLLLLLLLPWLGLGAAQGAGLPGEPESPQDLQLPRLLQRAARVALHFFNFRSGSPCDLRVLGAVQGGRAQVIDEDTLVSVTFTAERFRLEDPLRSGRCWAQVRFTPHRPRPSVNVSCTRLLAREQRQQENLQLFRLLKDLPMPLANTSIPDNHGHMEPTLRPLWEMVALGSSFVMWEKSTKTAQFSLVQLSGVQQWKTNHDTIHADYTVLLHEFTTQEMLSCHIHQEWHPGKPPRVKYHCSEAQMPEEASGTEE